MATTSNPTIAVHNVETGEVIEREQTAEEIAVQAEATLEFQTLQSEQQAKAAARTSALAKLAELGLTAEEIAAL
jgi:hypothetical protein